MIPRVYRRISRDPQRLFSSSPILHPSGNTSAGYCCDRPCLHCRRYIRRFGNTCSGSCRSPRMRDREWWWFRNRCGRVLHTTRCNRREGNGQTHVTLPTTTVTYNSENPPKGVAPPKTTTPAVTIRINTTPAFVPIKTTTAPVTTLTTQRLTPFQTIATRASVVTVTSTPCRDCGTTTVTPGVNRTIALPTTTARIAAAQKIAPQQGSLTRSSVSSDRFSGRNPHRHRKGGWHSISPPDPSTRIFSVQR